MSVLGALRRPRTPQRSGGFHDAVVLSGGGSLGAAQVGALRALLEAGIAPDLVVGCSVGALNGAFFAMDPTLARVRALEALWRALDRSQVFPSSRRTVAGHLVRRHTHLYEPSGLRSLVSKWLDATDLGGTRIPCHVVTTDLFAGTPTWWAAGDPQRILVASASLPGLFPPVDIDGNLHVDGGVVCPVPVQRAVDLGARRIWVLDVTGGTVGRRDERMTALDVLLTSFAVSRNRLSQAELLPRPGLGVFTMPSLNLGHHELRDFSKTDWLIKRGQELGGRMAHEGLALVAS